MCKYTLGDNIRKWRQFRGFQQVEFARKLGLSAVSLSKYENGRTDIGIATLSEIANLLSIDLSELVKQNKETNA